MTDIDLQTELAETRARLRALKLRQKAENRARKRSAIDPDSNSDAVWGMRAIARVLNVNEHQAGHMFRSGALDGVARKLSHKRVVASRAALLALIGKPASSET
jgi:hypothetical protein